MSRLIDADALKVSITKYGELHISHKKLPVVKNEAKELIRDICFAIDAKSTADVVPVVHGHWIGSEINGFDRCSNCKAIWDISLTKRNMFFRYCPRCGAKMDS